MQGGVRKGGGLRAEGESVRTEVESVIRCVAVLRSLCADKQNRNQVIHQTHPKKGSLLQARDLGASSFSDLENCKQFDFDEEG